MVAKYFFILFLLIQHRGLAAVSAKDVATDAQIRITNGDLFQSYRDYTYLESEYPTLFSPLGLDGYIQSLFIVGSANLIQEECNRLVTMADESVVAKSAYSCGLFYLEKRKPPLAEEFLKKIKNNSKFVWPALILRTTAALALHDPAKASALLSKADVSAFTKLGLENQYNLARARISVAQYMYDDAIKYYQAVSSSSDLYIDALEEISWIFFKVKKYESARVLLDVIIGNYEGIQKSGSYLKISSSNYFQSRYLKAYLSLVEAREDGAASEFSDLRRDIDNFSKKQIAFLDAKESLTQIHSSNIKWAGLKELPLKVREQLKLVGEWIGPDIQKTLESDLLFQLSLSRELARSTVLKKDELPTYLSTIDKLKNRTWEKFSKKYKENIDRLGQGFRALSLKAELGRMEIIWMARSQGARNMDEVLENYQQRIRSLDEFMER